MDHRLSRVTAVAAVAALAVPAVAAAKDREHGHGDDRAKRKPVVTYVLKGTVTSVDAAGSVVRIGVTRANRHGRRLVGRQLALSVAADRVTVADVNDDGTEDLADVQVGDSVLAQVRLPKRAAVADTVVARKLVDLTHEEDEEDESADEDEG
jgi:hypothetical protein